MNYNMIGAALAIALLVTKKDAPFKLSAKLRKTGLTVFNCVLCCYGWAVLTLFATAFYFGDSEVFKTAIDALALVGWGWLALALTGLANWDN